MEKINNTKKISAITLNIAGADNIKVSKILYKLSKDFTNFKSLEIRKIRMTRAS